MNNISNHSKKMMQIAISSALLVFSASELSAQSSNAQNPSGPVLQYEQFRRKVEFRVADAREKQIEGLEKLLGLGTELEEIPKLKFRLADLYFEKSQFYFFRSQETDDQVYSTESPDEKERLKAQKEVYEKEAKLWSRRATQIYEEIREKYPTYPRIPEVLFALGQNYWSRGKRDDAIDVYRDLIREYEDSPLVADAWLAFGEYYFARGALEQALKSYEIAASDKRSKAYGFALYKQAWCYYNLGEWEKSLKKFQATVFYSQMADELSGENKISLAREAEKDYVKTYAHVGSARRAKAVLMDIANVDDCTEEKCLKLMEKLADEWRGQGKFQDAASTYRQIIALQPTSYRNAYFQSLLVDLASRRGDKNQVIDEVRTLTKLYEKLAVRQNEGAVGKERKRIKSALQEARRDAENNIRKLAQTWNRESVKTRQEKTAQQALNMYQEYLKLFPKAKLAYELRFQMADLLYRLEKFGEAAEAYKLTVLADPKGKHLVAAARDGIIAVEEHLRDLRLKKVKPTKQKRDIHPERIKLIEACDRYIQSVSGLEAKDIVKISFKAAKIYYQHGHFDQALKRFDRIVAEYPAAEESEFAANLVVDIHNIKEDWQSLYESASRYLKMPDLLNGREKLQKDLVKFGQHVKFQFISEEQEKLQAQKSSLRPIAEAYEAFQREFPTSENADKALFNASVVWDSLGDKARADEIRERLLTGYPDSPLRADVAFYSASSFEGQAKYAEAANQFSAFAMKYPKDKRARDALYNAAVFYAGIGEVQSAARLRERYLKLFGRAKGGKSESADIYFSIAKDYERANRVRQAAVHYEKFTKLFPTDDRFFDALWRQAVIYRKLRVMKKAEKAEGQLLAAYTNRARRKQAMPAQAADYASQIAVFRANKDYEKYSRQRLKPLNLKRPKKFQQSMQDKAEKRDKVIASYGKIVTQYKQATATIASLSKIASTWDNFVNALVQVPCPRALTEEQCTFFKEGLQEKTSNARESAYQAYVTCVTKSNELGVFTEESRNCVKALEELDPVAYPKIEEQQLTYDAKKQPLVIEPRPFMFRTRSKKTSPVSLNGGVN